MNKLTHIGILSIFLVILSGFVIAQNPPLCLETDSGNNPAQPGQMAFGNWVYNDYCMDASNLHERYCVPGSYLPARGTQVYCPYGCKLNDKGLAGCVTANGTVAPGGLFTQLENNWIPPEWKPAGSNPIIYQDSQTGSEEVLEEESFMAFDEQINNAEVPEFSVLAAGIAFAGAGLGYMFMRKRR